MYVQVTDSRVNDFGCIWLLVMLSCWCDHAVFGEIAIKNRGSREIRQNDQ